MLPPGAGIAKPTARPNRTYNRRLRLSPAGIYGKAALSHFDLARQRTCLSQGGGLEVDHPWRRRASRDEPGTVDLVLLQLKKPRTMRHGSANLLDAIYLRAPFRR